MVRFLSSEELRDWRKRVYNREGSRVLYWRDPNPVRTVTDTSGVEVDGNQATLSVPKPPKRKRKPEELADKVFDDIYRWMKSSPELYQSRLRFAASHPDLTPTQIDEQWEWALRQKVWASVERVLRAQGRERELKLNLGNLQWKAE